MSKKSENQQAAQKKLWDQAFFNTLNLFIGAVKVIVLLCFCGLLYGFLGDSLKSMFSSPPVLSKEQLQKRQFRRAVAGREAGEERVEGGIHVATGLVYAEHFNLVRATCTACHSAKLITQNKASKEGWKEMILWMQETQGLWDLGPSEAPILKYLATHYAPEQTGRRPNLPISDIEWYFLEE